MARFHHNGRVEIILAGNPVPNRAISGGLPRTSEKTISSPCAKPVPRPHAMSPRIRQQVMPLPIADLEIRSYVNQPATGL